ncbi:hypothetical protein GCM10007148_10700 [Parvularcula lutaonensis]|nr:hypothetical protein GCM10007148_10700 [Parvularcula lutaonensis]
MTNDPLYGPRYAQVVVRKADNVIASNGPFACDSKSILSQFMKGLGIRSDGQAAVTVSVRHSRNPTVYLAKDLPIYVATKRGNECNDFYLTKAITPFVKPLSQETVLLEFEVRHSRKDQSSIGEIFSLAQEISSLVSQNATDGLVSDLTKFTTSGLAEKTEALLARFKDSTGVISGAVEMPLSLNSRNIRSDRYTFSLIKPQGRNGGISFDPSRTEVIPIILEASFAPSIFAGCPTHRMVAENAADAGSITQRAASIH